jgi:hypothetical protein
VHLALERGHDHIEILLKDFEEVSFSEDEVQDGHHHYLLLLLFLLPLPSVAFSF